MLLQLAQLLHLLRIQVILLILLKLFSLIGLSLGLRLQALDGAAVGLLVDAHRVGLVEHLPLLLLELLRAQISRKILLEATILVVNLLMQLGLGRVVHLTLVGLGGQLHHGTVEAIRLDLSLPLKNAVDILARFLLLLLFLARLLLVIVDQFLVVLRPVIVAVAERRSRQSIGHRLAVRQLTVKIRRVRLEIGLALGRLHIRELLLLL